MAGNLLDTVLDYHRRGWCIIPVITRAKQTTIRWKKFQEEISSTEQLKSWFREKRYSPAVILGPVSSGLVCRDFDIMESFQRWQETYPDLAKILPTVKTARGAHVYFHSDWTGFHNLDDGELRGDSKHYCLVPPAIHPEGSRYDWIIPLPAGDLPRINPFEHGLGPPEILSHVTDANRCKQIANIGNSWGEERFLPNSETEAEAESEGSEAEKFLPESDRVAGGVGLVPRSVSVFGEDENKKKRIEKAIADTLPQREGQRNRAIFDFARKLKSCKFLAKCNSKDLEPLVREWHKRALPFIRTKSFVETWIDFLKGWGNVKFPADEEFLPMILEQAQKEPLQQWDDERVCVLAAVCRELGKLRDNGEFYIATRTAGKLLGVSHTQISRWLFLLEHDGIIQTLTKGGTAEAPRKATRFRYIGPD